MKSEHRGRYFFKANMVEDESGEGLSASRRAMSLLNPDSNFHPFGAFHSVVCFALPNHRPFRTEEIVMDNVPGSPPE